MLGRDRSEERGRTRGAHSVEDLPERQYRDVDVGVVGATGRNASQIRPCWTSEIWISVRRCRHHLDLQSVGRTVVGALERLRIAAMQTLVGALIDIAGFVIGGVTLAKGDQAPSETIVGLLDQLEHESIGRL
jgi:hypothetical protein